MMHQQLTPHIPDLYQMMTQKMRLYSSNPTNFQSPTFETLLMYLPPILIIQHNYLSNYSNLIIIIMIMINKLQCYLLVIEKFKFQIKTCTLYRLEAYPKIKGRALYLHSDHPIIQDGKYQILRHILMKQRFTETHPSK